MDERIEVEQRALTAMRLAAGDCRMARKARITMTEEEGTRRCIAVHEAAHAVLMVLFDHPFAFITIQPNEDALGAVVHERGESPPAHSATGPQYAYERMIVLCAGYIAGRYQQGYDVMNTMDLLNFSDEQTSDGATFRKLTAPLRAAGPDAMLIIRAVAVSLLIEPTIWRAVEIIRDMLLSQTTVPYAGAKAAINDVLTAAIRNWTKDVIVLVDQEIRAAIKVKFAEKGQTDG